MAESLVQYVESMPDGGYRIAGTRVSLDSIVHAYWDGQQPESIVANFPTLSLERVHGAIAYYLRNRDEVDRDMAKRSELWDEVRKNSELKLGPLFRRIRQSQMNPAQVGDT